MVVPGRGIVQQNHGVGASASIAPRLSQVRQPRLASDSAFDLAVYAWARTRIGIFKLACEELQPSAEAGDLLLPWLIRSSAALMASWM